VQRSTGPAALPALLALLAGCSSQPAQQTGRDGATGTIRLTICWSGGEPTGADGFSLSARGAEVSARVVPPRTHSVTISVTGRGISTPITRTVTRPLVESERTQVSLDVPGHEDHRTVTVQAFDVAGELLAERSVQVTVLAGATNTVGVQLAATDAALQALSPWPKFHGNRFGTGLSPAIGAQTPTKRWEFAGPNADGDVAIGADGTIYVGSLDVHAVNGSTGALRWEFTLHWGAPACPAIGADGTVYVGSDDGELYALDGATGAQRWTFAHGSEAPAIAADGAVYVGGGHMYCVDGATGAQLWEFTPASSVAGCPAIGADGSVYIGSWDGRVYALDGATGAKLWLFAAGADVRGSLALGPDGTVYFGCYDHKVYALNAADGSKRWDLTTGGIIWSSPAIGPDGTIYIGSHDNNVYAIDPDTGRAKWTFTTGGWVDSSPAIGADGTVYVGSDDDCLYALDGATGAEKWRFTTGDDVDSSPAIGSDGTVYFGSEDGNLYAIGP